MSLQSRSAIASSVPVVCIPKRQFQASPASTRWNTSRRSWHLFVLSIAVLVPSVTAGEWLPSCSANDRIVLKAQVEKCGPTIAKNTYTYIPTTLDFNMTKCDPACKCFSNPPSVLFARDEDFSNCSYTTVVEIYQGALYFMPASMCAKSCDQCVGSNCQFRCTSVASSSCFVQMRENGSNPTVPVTTTTVSTTKSESTPIPAVNKPSALSAGEIVGIVTRDTGGSSNYSYLIRNHSQ
jgi:hypothetical protein